ncbi:hypothetical protein RUM43_004119 [Polyplax serrata]|uniref:EF-hand domain-containing protein n=1 Tax=Polyplax serrata TaxID=468196 RepID=A0AAN8SAK6_POLSC
MRGYGVDSFFIEEVENYTQLTYLKRSEIFHIYSRFKRHGQEVATNIHHRFEKSKILEIFPELNYNPFIDRTLYIFSSMKDDRMSFEDILDLASAFSEDCPVDVKAKWAFLIFDFDQDNLLNSNDIVEMVTRLTKSGDDTSGEEQLTEEEKRKVADLILNDVVLCNADGITCVEFINIVRRIPEFLYAFRIKFT